MPIVSAGDVPLILLGEVDGHRAVYFTFDPVRSNLPVQVTFPVLGARIIDWLAGNRLGAEAVADAGTPIPVGAARRRLRRGDDTRRRDGRRSMPRCWSSPAPEQPGIYRVSYVDADGSRVGEVLATRRYVAAESAATPRAIAVVEPDDGGLEDTTLIREWAPLILALLLALVLLEWWVAFGRPRPWRRDRRRPTTGTVAT